MKLILSRKGFDATNGGCPSPIFEDGSILSLPIPAPSRLRYSQIAWKGRSIGDYVERLSRGRVARDATAHLDPDLRRDAIARRPGWRPIFGQAGAAQSHLARCGVGAGDMFLFFGWFRQVERNRGDLRYVTGAPDLHVIFGWMQIGSVYEVCKGLRERIPWASDHPHLGDGRARTRNTIYVASESALGLDLPSAGTFQYLRPQLVLTKLNPYLGRSVWRLPRWFRYRRDAPLSRHGNRSRWRRMRDHVELRSVPIGQEFAVDLDRYPDAIDWLRSLLETAAA